MKSIKQIIGIAMVLAAVSIALVYIYFDCPITFKSGLKIENVVSLLLSFGVIAILIERFSTQFLIRDDYVDFMAANRIKGYGTYKVKSRKQSDGSVYSLLEEQDLTSKEFKQKLFWMSWGIGMVLSAIGYRFFYNIIEVRDCGVSYHEGLTVFADVFMTGVLLSGGSALVLELIMWWRGDEN